MAAAPSIPRLRTRPAPLSPRVGREREGAALDELRPREDARLLSVRDPGGAGAAPPVPRAEAAAEAMAPAPFPITTWRMSRSDPVARRLGIAPAPP